MDKACVFQIALTRHINDLQHKGIFIVLKKKEFTVLINLASFVKALAENMNFHNALVLLLFSVCQYDKIPLCQGTYPKNLNWFKSLMNKHDYFQNKRNASIQFHSTIGDLTTGPTLFVNAMSPLSSETVVSIAKNRKTLQQYNILIISTQFALFDCSVQLKSKQ